MYSLIRFFKEKEYLNEFLDGDIFMHSIGHFRKIETNPKKFLKMKIGIEPENDYYEGVYEILSVDEIKAKYNFDLRVLFGDHIIAPVVNIIDAYKYVHLLCMSLLPYDNEYEEVERIDKTMAKYGRYAVLVYNVEEFVDRLFINLQQRSMYGLMGPVNYYSFLKESKYRDCFDKSIKYKTEREWRLALIPSFEEAKRLADTDKDGSLVYDEHFTFKIGSIKGIAEEVNVETLLTDPGALYRNNRGQSYKTVDHLTVDWPTRKKQLDTLSNLGFPIPYDAYPEQYVGWAPREAFRNKVLQLGTGLKPVMYIG